MTEQTSDDLDSTGNLTGKIEMCKELLDQVLAGMKEKPDLHDDDRAKSFGEAYRNGYRDGIQNHLSWIIDMHDYIEECTTFEELNKFKKNFLMFMNENIKKIDRDPTGLPFDDSTMYIVESEPTDDSNKVGTVIATSVLSYYRAGDCIVRKQPVIVYSDGVADDESLMTIEVRRGIGNNVEDTLSGGINSPSPEEGQSSNGSPRDGIDVSKSPVNPTTEDTSLKPSDSEEGTYKVPEGEESIERIGNVMPSDDEPINNMVNQETQDCTGNLNEVSEEDVSDSNETSESPKSDPRSMIHVKGVYRIIFRIR